MRKSISLALSLVGLFAALYLLWTYVSPSSPMVCLGGGCDAVRASAYAYPRGVPMPVFGVAGYLLIILLLVATPLVSPTPARWARYALAAGTAFGFLFSLYLDYLQGFVIHAYCAWCLTSSAVMTALFALAIYDVVRPEPERDASQRLALTRRFLVIGVVGLLIGIPVFRELVRHGGELPPPPKPLKVALTARLVRTDSHATGNLASPVTVVEFGDFECPVCGEEERVMREIRAKYANQVRFVFRQFPLTRIHPFAWRAAEASECAAEQGKFWQAVDAIYSRQADLTDKGLLQDAVAIGLDPVKFNSCMSDGAVAGRIRQDVEDGQTLGIDATPTFFIGRQEIVGARDVKEFSQLIDQELAAHRPELTSASQPPSPAAPPPAPAPARAQGSTRRATAPQDRAPAVLGAPASLPPLGSSGTPTLFGQSPFSGSQPACSEAEAAGQQPSLLDTAQLRQLLAAGTKPLFVDVRSRSDFARSKIPGAVNIPAGEMAQLWNTLPKNRVLVLYESGETPGDVCAASRAAARVLLQHGYPTSQVKVYQDGLAGWKKSALRPAP